MRTRRTIAFECAAIAAAIAACIGASPAPTAAPPAPTAGASPASAADQVLNKFQTAWDAVKTYKVTISATEYQNGNTQARTYILWFEKPHHVRLDVVAGDNKGAVAVWDGGDTVYGHRGGILSAIKLNLNIHNKMATSMRGTTIAQSYFGADLDHLKTTKWKSMDVTIDGDHTTLTVIADAPDQNDGIAKEVVLFGSNLLPLELTQYEPAGGLAKHVKYSELTVNQPIDPSLWQI